MSKKRQPKCPYCGRNAEWVSNEIIYGRRIGKSHMIWLCRPCDAYVGCHNNTMEAKGTLANARLRAWRRNAHGVIDPLWQYGPLRRAQVYERLSKHFGFQVHIGEADERMCKKIMTAAEILFP